MLTPIDFSNKRIVLGSSSAQRKKILRENLGISDFEVIKSDFEENIDKASCATVEEYVERTCRAKFDDIMQNKIAGDEPDLLLCADTVIAIKEDDGKEKETILEKASDRAHAISMLKMMSGRKHRVVTAVLFRMKGQDVLGFTDSTEVQFNELPEKAIDAYVDSGEAYGKAGAYGIQSLGASFVRKIDGCYYNVVGLPIKLASMLM